MRNKKICEFCKYWKLPDLSVKDVGNIGTCIWMMPRDMSAYNNDIEHAPWWAKEIAYRTVSWQGENCGVFKRKKP